MRDFMKRAFELYVDQEAGWCLNHFERVLEARRKLQRAYAKSRVDIDNIEELFARFEMAGLIGRLADLRTDDAVDLSHHLRFTIMRTIEKSIQFQLKRDDNAVHCPFPYCAFAELLKKLNCSQDLSPVAVISFNYDLALDYALHMHGFKIRYGIEQTSSSKGSLQSNPEITLLKPHGSLNWHRSDPQRIEVQRVITLNAPEIRKRLGLHDSLNCSIDTMELVAGPGGWGERPRPEPVIVPPAANKAAYQGMFQIVWREAATSLSSAENIIIIGYSFPTSDQFFRSFFALSTISDSIIERFWVFDPADLSERLLAIMGPAIIERRCFVQHRMVFEAAIPTIAKELNVPEPSLDGLLKRWG